jgi:hypothetical protein
MASEDAAVLIPAVAAVHTRGAIPACVSPARVDAGDGSPVPKRVLHVPESRRGGSATAVVSAHRDAEADQNIARATHGIPGSFNPT